MIVLTRQSVPQALPLLLRVSILVLTAFIFVAVILPFRCSSHSADMLCLVVTVLMALAAEEWQALPQPKALQAGMLFLAAYPGV